MCKYLSIPPNLKKDKNTGMVHKLLITISGFSKATYRFIHKDILHPTIPCNICTILTLVHNHDPRYQMNF